MKSGRVVDVPVSERRVLMFSHYEWLYSPLLFQMPERIGTSAWLEHTPFAFWLIDRLRPRRMVELGSHNGISFCAFAQAVKQLKLETRCHAVDTWQGDPHAGYYGDEVYNDLARFIGERYGTFSRLERSTFDKALPLFEDGSIDLLHIDGLHTYEAVSHDYHSWLPKLREGGIILFHDTNVRRDDFGVYRLWAELLERVPGFEFLHGFGLGVLSKGRPDAAMETLFRAATDPIMTRVTRQTFAHLGGTVSTRHELTATKVRLNISRTASMT